MLSVSNYEYSQGDLLGHGAFALVFKGRRKRDHRLVAIKQIALKSVPGKLSSIRQKEITILKELKNANIVQLHDYLETPSDIFLVMEYCNGGDLGDYLIAKKTLSENSIRHLCRHIALALEALVKLHIIHRDIKPQNLLLSYPSSSPTSSSTTTTSTSSTRSAPFTEAIIKLADFGFARYLTGADMAATLCGSPLYMAPEILMGQRYDSSADLWSVGTILFQCLSGHAPFWATNPHALKRRYEREKLTPKIPEGTSHYLSDLLLALLKKNPKERLSYSDFFHHNFLKTPSSFSSDPMLTFRPSQTVKSSPVPIKRPPSTPHSSPSPHQHHHNHHHHQQHQQQHHQHQSSASNSHGSSVDLLSFSPSSFSGPPLSHRVGSQASLPYYSAQSPNMDVTDQGFILVDFPGGPGSRRCSVSSNGGGGAPQQSSGRSSSRNSAPSQSPSSASGSLSRYSSLTTPFYQPPPPQSSTRQGGTPSSSRGCGPEGATPVNKSPKLGGTHSGVSNPYHHGGAVGAIPCQTSPPSSNGGVGHLPFGRLIQPRPYQGLGYSPASASAASNFSNLSSTSSGSHYRHCHASPITSPASTPGSHNPYQQQQQQYAPTMPTTPGSRGSLSRRNSGAKLCALAEERERRGGVKKTKKSGVGRGGDEGKEKVNSGGFDVITQSCLLGFSGDEEEEEGGGGGSVGDTASLDEEENFPLSLTMSQEEEEEDNEGVEPQAWRSHTHPDVFTSGNAVQILGSDAVHYAPVTTPSQPRPLKDRKEEAGSGSAKPRRAASFSHHQRSTQLSQELAALYSKASSLSAHGDPFAPGFSAATPPLTSSPSAEIVALKLPFTFSDSMEEGREGEGVSHPLAPTIAEAAGGKEEGEIDVCFGSLKLSSMRDSLVLAREMHAMAKARQGPILLMSTSSDLGDSGIAGRRQRCAEQLVLYAKAFSVLDSLSTRYSLELALASNQEPPRPMKKVVDEASALMKSCLQEAKDIRQEVLAYKENTPNGSSTKVSAERLLFLEALDMCKAAVLDEKSVDEMECIKRYRRARIIFKHLLLEAKSQRDQHVLQKYIASAQARINHLLQ